MNTTNKIWITGVAGFLGSHLADSLQSLGYDVHGNDSLICGDTNNLKGLKFYLTDCRDFAALKSLIRYHHIDTLVHCAATAHEGFSSFSPSFITKNIYEASVATFSAAIAGGVKRIIFMSSMSRYGNGFSDYSGHKGVPFNENYRTNPVDPYGIAKVAAEETLKVLCDTHGIEWSIAVPHNIIGVRQRYIDPYRNVASIMINRAKQGKPIIIYGDGEQTRCFSPVKDCIPSIIKMVEGDAIGEIINIGPDSGEISINRLAEIVKSITGSDLGCIHLPDRPNEVKHAYCSSSKARAILGYKEEQSIEDCLKEMAEAIIPTPFDYNFPIEIDSKKIPSTWKEKLL